MATEHWLTVAAFLAKCQDHIYDRVQPLVSRTLFWYRFFHQEPFTYASAVCNAFAQLTKCEPTPSLEDLRALFRVITPYYNPHSGITYIESVRATIEAIQQQHVTLLPIALTFVNKLLVRAALHQD